VTSYTTTTAVPVFQHGEAGPHRGSPGVYDVVLILGIPGLTSVTTSINLDESLVGGDSLLVGAGLELRLDSGTGVAGTAQVIPNREGRLAQVRASIQADDFAAAERLIHNLVVPTLSLLAFHADVALETTGMLLTEHATQIKRFSTTMLGTFQPAPTPVGVLTPPLRLLLATYREGLNSNSPLYQALSFYKVLEHVKALATQQRRSAARAGQTVTDPIERRLPTDLADFPEHTEWEVEVFAGYLGKTYTEVRTALTDTIRNAVAHLTPGRDVRSADLLADIQACRDAVPVLRYIARALISDELSRT